MFEDAVTLKYIADSPAAKIKTPHRNVDIQQKAYIGSDDVTIFLNAISGQRLEAAFLLALYYGLRREEILGLKWSAIHDDGKLQIGHTVSRVRNRKLFGNKYIDSDYVFTWEDGHCCSPDYLTKSFRKIVRNDNRLDDSLTLHSLRASCVSILIHSGTDIKDVQAWVGHKDVQTTLNIYARTTKNSKIRLLIGWQIRYFQSDCEKFMTKFVTEYF